MVPVRRRGRCVGVAQNLKKPSVREKKAEQQTPEGAGRGGTRRGRREKGSEARTSRRGARKGRGEGRADEGRRGRQREGLGGSSFVGVVSPGHVHDRPETPHRFVQIDCEG